MLRTEIEFHFRPPPHVCVANCASPCNRRLVLSQTRARRAKDRSLQAGIGVHPLPAQGTRATLALRAYITRKRLIRELSRFDLSTWHISWLIGRLTFVDDAFFSRRFLYRFRYEAPSKRSPRFYTRTKCTPLHVNPFFFRTRKYLIKYFSAYKSAR